MAEKFSQQERQALRLAPIFSALSDSALEDLLGRCRKVKATVGARLFAAEQRATAFYVLLSGRVKVFKLSARGDEQILHHYGPGSTFGEAAVLTGGNYPAFAEALEPSVVVPIDRDTLRQAVANNPELALGMLGGLSRKLREFARLIEQLSLKEVPARLADVLLEMASEAHGPTFELSQSKRQLAAQIGTVAETLSRAFRKLRSAGLIRVEGSQITILNAEALKVLADEG